jgi:hypothetical protein
MPTPRKKTPQKPQVQYEENVPAVGRYFTPNDAEWGGFINIRITDEQKEEFQTWAAQEGERLWDYIDELLGDSMKIGMSYDRENECVIVTFTGSIPSTLMDSRYVMTTRAGTLSECLQLAVWKHVILLRGDWGNYRPRNSGVSWG